MKKLNLILIVLLFLSNISAQHSMSDAEIYSLVNQGIRHHIEIEKEKYKERIGGTCMEVFVLPQPLTISRRYLQDIHFFIYDKLNRNEKETSKLTYSNSDSIKYGSFRQQILKLDSLPWNCDSLKWAKCIQDIKYDFYYRTFSDSIEAKIAYRYFDDYPQIDPYGRYYGPRSASNHERLAFRSSYPLFFEYENELYAILFIPIYFGQNGWESARLNHISIDLYKKEGANWVWTMSEWSSHRDWIM